MSDTDVARKLLLKPGTSFLLLNAPPEYGSAIAAASEDVRQSEQAGDGSYDLVQVFAVDRANLTELWPQAVGAVRPGGILWITYPKQSGAIRSDLNRDRIRELTADSGWQPVTQIAIDDTWSALRFRPNADVGH